MKTFELLLATFVGISLLLIGKGGAVRELYHEEERQLRSRGIPVSSTPVFAGPGTWETCRPYEVVQARA